MLVNAAYLAPTAYPLTDGWEVIASYDDGEVEARYNAAADFAVLVDVDTDFPITQFTGLKDNGRDAALVKFNAMMGV